jgi:hypothetical protein
MSIANLFVPNNFSLYVNPPVVNLQPILGACTFLGTAVPNYTCNAYTIGNLVYLDIVITGAASGTVAAISFANSLPANLLPATCAGGTGIPLVLAGFNTRNVTGGANVATSAGISATAGALTFTMGVNSVNTNNYTLKATVMYSLS